MGQKESKGSALSVDGTVSELTAVVRYFLFSFMKDTERVEEIFRVYDSNW